MRISRRAVLSVAPAAALWSVARPGGTSQAPSAWGSVAPAGAVGTRAGDPARLMANTVAVFAGTAESNARPEVAAKLAAIDVDRADPARRDGRAPATASCSPGSRSAPATPT